MKFKISASTCGTVIAFGAFMLGSESRAVAGVIFTFAQSGGDVIEAGSGTLDLSALAHLGGTAFSFDPLQASLGLACVGAWGVGLDSYVGTFAGPASFGPGGLFKASSALGQEFAVIGGGNIDVPAGYISGGALSGTATFTGETLDSLGLTVGTYTWTWGAAEHRDFFKVVVGSGITATPEPSTALFVALPLAFLLLRFRRNA